MKYLENANKTHYIMNMDIGRTLRFYGYTVVLSSHKNERVEPSFTVLMSEDHNYLIHGTPDDRKDIS